jgi:beta-hydroxylase
MEDFVKYIEENYLEIKTEFESVVSENLYQSWPETQLYNYGWNVFGLRFQGNDIEAAHSLCPTISHIIKKYDRLVDTLGFSILNPGTIINKHIGYTDKVLRCHLGISVPDGDCALKVGNDIIHWENGKAFIFDDTIEHGAWNLTTQKRVVMLVDLNKHIF